MDALRHTSAGPVLSALTQGVGATPVLHLARFGRALPSPIYAKLELRSPTGSGKDRLALAALDGLDVKQPVVVPSTGNFAVSLAWAAAARGFAVHAVIPRASSLELRQLLALYKAKVELSPSELGVQGARERAKALAQELGAQLVDPFADARLMDALKPLADEIATFSQTVKLAGVVCGLGSGLTARALRTHLPELPLIAVEPSESAVHSDLPRGPHKVHGIGVGFRSAHLDGFDGIRFAHVSVSDAWKAKRQLAADEGLFAGPTTGACLAVAAREASHVKGALLVLAMDTGERYFSQEALVS